MILSNFPTKTITPESIGAIPNPTGGTAGQVLTKTADGSAWEDAPSGLPDGGADGQMLYKSADGAAWGDKPVMVVRVSATGNQDKTISEIFQAYQNNYAIYCVLDDELVLYPAVIKKNYAMFACIHNLGSSPTDIGDLKFYVVYIDDSGIAVSDSSELSSLFLENPTGTQGQLLGFTADNTVGAVDAPESGLTQEQADERYLQLTGGEASNQPFNLTNTIGTRSTTFNLVGEIGANLYFNGLGGPVTGITFNNAGIEFTGGQGRISYLSSPENDEDAANKAYVDQAVANIGGGIVVQATAPENTSLGWIDTSVGGVMKYYDPETSTWKGIIGVWGCWMNDGTRIDCPENSGQNRDGKAKRLWQLVYERWIWLCGQKPVCELQFQYL